MQPVGLVCYFSFDNKDSAKKKHRQIYRFIKVLCDRAEVPAGRGEYILQSNVFLQSLSSILFRKATEHGREETEETVVPEERV